MNINTHPVVNGKAQIGADTMELPKEALDKLTPEDKNEIIVGFRPEDASLAAPDEANAFSLKVVNVEDLGSDGYIYGNIITDDSVAQKTTDTLMSDQNQLTTIRVNPRVLPRSATSSRSRSTRPRCTSSPRRPSCVSTSRRIHVETSGSAQVGR